MIHGEPNNSVGATSLSGMECAAASVAQHNQSATKEVDGGAEAGEEEEGRTLRGARKGVATLNVEAAAEGVVCSAPGVRREDWFGGHNVTN